MHTYDVSAKAHLGRLQLSPACCVYDRPMYLNQVLAQSVEIIEVFGRMSATWIGFYSGIFMNTESGERKPWESFEVIAETECMMGFLG